MKINSTQKPIQTLMNNIKRGKISFNHKFQRREGAWGKYQKSLLIDSILKPYPINNIFAVINSDGISEIIDGVQRLSTCRDFYNDIFSLHKSIPNITIDGIEYEIAGKKFSQLDEALQDLFKSKTIVYYTIEDYEDWEVREMFARLNGGKALNTIQKLAPLMSDDLNDAIVEIINHDFFEKVLSPSQLKSSVDHAIALEILMLSELSAEYDFGSFSKTDREKFIKYYNNKVNNEKVRIIIQALDKLNDLFTEDTKIQKTSISMAVYGMYKVIKDHKNTEKFAEKLIEFLNGYSENIEYLAYCNQGTSSAESVKGRLSFFKEMIKNIQ